MTLRSNDVTYGTLARGLHWVSAALVVVLIALGLAMTRINSGDNTTLYRLHVALGLLIAGLTIVRVIWRFVEPSPVAPPMAPWRRKLFVANHYALYVGLLVLAATGIATLLANDLTPFPPDVVASDVDDVRAGDAHFVLALAYTGLLIMHIVGIATYQRSKGPVVHKMGINLGGEHADPSRLGQ